MLHGASFRIDRWPGGSIDRSGVVLIDDDSDFRQIVAIYVRLGLVCIEVADCASTLTLRAVLLDHFLPGLDSPACAEAVLARAARCAGHPRERCGGSAERASELGLGRFPAKLFEISQIREVLSV